MDSTVNKTNDQPRPGTQPSRCLSGVFLNFRTHWEHCVHYVVKLRLVCCYPNTRGFNKVVFSVFYTLPLTDGPPLVRSRRGAPCRDTQITPRVRQLLLDAPSWRFTLSYSRFRTRVDEHRRPLELLGVKPPQAAPMTSSARLSY